MAEVGKDYGLRLGGKDGTEGWQEKLLTRVNIAASLTRMKAGVEDFHHSIVTKLPKQLYRSRRRTRKRNQRKRIIFTR